MPRAGRALAFFSRKHFWHALKKHFVGFKVVFRNQSSFFSETSFVESNQHSIPHQSEFFEGW